MIFNLFVDTCCNTIMVTKVSLTAFLEYIQAIRPEGRQNVTSEETSEATIHSYIYYNIKFRKQINIGINYQYSNLWSELQMCKEPSPK